MVGASLIGRTIKVKTSVSVYSPSVTDTLICTSPKKSSAGVKVNSLPTRNTDTKSGYSLNALKFNSSPSISSAARIKDNGISSSVICEPISPKTGASFTGSI